MKVDLNKARTFVEVVDSGSITAAANRLLRTQQAISSQLQQLEAEVNLNLFDRQGPKIILTEDGERLFQQFKPHVLAMESAVQDLKSEKQHAGGVIRLGAWVEQAVSYLPEMIQKFKQLHPLVEFTLLLAEDAEIEQMLIDNRVDFGFQVYCQDKKLFKCEPVYRQPLLPVISRRFLTRHKAPTCIEDTLDYPLLDYADEYSAYNLWIEKNSRELLPQARKKIRSVTCSNNVALKQLVLQGLGIGFLHQEAIQAELETGELTPLFNQSGNQNIQVELDMVYKRKQVFSYVHQQFVDFLRQQRDSWMV